MSKSNNDLIVTTGKTYTITDSIIYIGNITLK